MGVAYILVSDVIKAYSSIATDFDIEDNDLLNYFERVWVGPKKGRGIFTMFISIIHFIPYSIKLGSRRSKPGFNLQVWNVYERVIQGLPRSNNAVEEWYLAFNNRVSIKHPSITRLAKCILREQAKFEIDIKRLRTGEQPKKKKKKIIKIWMHD